MEKAREEVIMKNNNNTAVEDIVRDHCYSGIKAKTVLLYHLTDHNYVVTEREKPKKKRSKPAQKPEKTIKITELRAIYNCMSCGYRTMDRDQSSKHNCDKKRARYVPCTKCDKYKAPEGYVQCTKCSYFTKNKSSLKVHMRIHLKGTPYKCTECDYSGRDLKDLISHYEAKDLKCDCGYTTHIRQHMLVHKRSHTGEKPFSCGICNYSSAHRAGLTRHLKKHEE